MKDRRKPPRMLTDQIKRAAAATVVRVVFIHHNRQIRGIEDDATAACMSRTANLPRAGDGRDEFSFNSRSERAPSNERTPKEYF